MSQRVTPQLVLDSISQKLFQEPYETIEKDQLEELGWIVTHKVVPLLEDKVLMKVLHITPDELKLLRRKIVSGESSSTSLLEYEKLKSWKKNRNPNKESRLILAKYLGYGSWAECEKKFEIPLSVKSHRSKRSVDWRMAILLVLAISAVFIALNLNKLTNVFERVSNGNKSSSSSEYKPADEKTRFINSIDTSEWKSPRYAESKNIQFERNEDEKLTPIPTHQIIISIDDKYSSCTFYQDGRSISPKLAGLNLFTFHVSASAKIQKWMAIADKDTCRYSLIPDQSKKVYFLCE